MKKRKHNPLLNTLCVIPVSTMGKRVAVELKNDSEIQGVIEEADQFMNITLIDAEQKNPNGKILTFEWAHIKGTTIRYIHYEESVNFVNSCKNYMKILRGTQNSEKGSRLRKVEGKPQITDNVIVQMKQKN